MSRGNAEHVPLEGAAMRFNRADASHDVWVAAASGSRNLTRGICSCGEIRETFAAPNACLPRLAFSAIKMPFAAIHPIAALVVH